jgi:two-component system chemotaxis response regulator CheY
MAAAADLSVLIVDDQMTMRSLIRNSMTQMGVNQTREAADGEEALRALLTRPSHLVISDFNMPKLDGLSLLRAVRTHPPLKSIAFIMLTGRADIDLVARARQFGVNNFIVKPFTTATLKEKIEEVFGVLT